MSDAEIPPTIPPARIKALTNDIAVDMDGSLFKTDTLWEGFFRALFHSPAEAFWAVLAIRNGRSAVKAAVRNHSIQGIATYPVRDELVSWLARETSSGRRVHLVTAADLQVAEEAARRFNMFDTVIATEGSNNLKGAAKRAALESKFADGWSYVGDSRHDIPVFMGAESVILAGHRERLQAMVSRSGKTIEAAFPREPATLRDWVRALRVHQWAKNLLIFVPLVLSGAFAHGDAVVMTLLAFLLTSLCASGTYVLNDLADLHSDRAHATKRFRPLAAARIPLLSAFAASLALILGSIASALVLMPNLGMLLALYTVTTVTYSMAFKRVPMFDVTILGSLYTLRLAIGAVAAGVALSGWLAAFSLCFFLSLSLAKRATEIQRYATADSIPGRGYVKDDYPLVLTFGISSGMVALLLMILFLVFQAFLQSTYVEPRWLLVTPMLTFLWLSRIWLLASRGQLKDDPVVFAIKDRASLSLGVLMGIATLAAVLGPRL